MFRSHMTLWPFRSFVDELTFRDGPETFREIGRFLVVQSKLEIVGHINVPRMGLCDPPFP
jgi:hypothetical protein